MCRFRKQVSHIVPDRLKVVEGVAKAVMEKRKVTDPATGMPLLSGKFGNTLRTQLHLALEGRISGMLPSTAS